MRFVDTAFAHCTEHTVHALDVPNPLEQAFADLYIPDGTSNRALLGNMNSYVNIDTLSMGYFKLGNVHQFKVGL